MSIYKYVSDRIDALLKWLWSPPYWVEIDYNTEELKQNIKKFKESEKQTKFEEKTKGMFNELIQHIQTIEEENTELKQKVKELEEYKSKAIAFLLNSK